jgi:hypothetical protein
MALTPAHKMIVLHTPSMSQKDFLMKSIFGQDMASCWSAPEASRLSNIWTSKFLRTSSTKQHVEYGGNPN